MELVVPYDGFVYHPHQAEAIQWMARRERTDAEFTRGGILAHEMGLGKTWTTLGHILNTPVPHTLILVPPVLQTQWLEALERARIQHDVLVPAHRTAPAHKRFVSYNCEDARPGIHVTLATYGRAARQSDALLAHGDFDRLVCDEGHVLRNGAATSMYRKIHALPIPVRWILSGTPVQNSKRDFVNLCQFLGMDRIEVRVKKPADIASVLVSRYTVDSAGESVAAMLPPVKPTHTIHSIVMPTDSDESQTFKSLVGRFQLAVERHAKTMILLELYLRIRQFLAHPSIYVNAMKRKYGERYLRSEWTGTASKMDTFASFLATTEVEPTIVFCNFREEMECAETIVRAAGYSSYMIRGGMTESERTASVELSRADVAAGRPVCILVQIMAGGAGLNLQHCSRVVFLSSHWNPAVVDQAVARAYRMGQTRAVTVHHFLMANGDDRNVDRVMMRLHGAKRRIVAEIHPGLACTTAVSTEDTITKLDDTLAAAPPELSDELLEPQDDADPDDLEDDPDMELLQSQHVV
jgi:SNF2 family DNA or RNA helicase